MFGVIRGGVLGTGAFGVLTAAVFGARRVVGMGRVFPRALVMDMLITRGIFMSLVAGRGCLEGGRVGQSHRRQRLTGVDMVVFMDMIVLVVSMFVIVRMPVMIVMPGIIMMLRIGMMFGVVRVGMAVFVVQVFRVALMRLGGL